MEANHILAELGFVSPRPSASIALFMPPVTFPVIVKPEREDGSIGICRESVVYDPCRLREQIAYVVETYKQPAVVQSYVPGREFAVSLLGWPVPRVLPPGEIVFDALPEGHPPILTFSSKWHADSIDWQCAKSLAAVLRPPELRRVAAIGRRAFEVLGLADYGRVDVRLDDHGTPYVIDVNPNCDVSEESGFGLAAGRAGLTYSDVVWEILRSALRRKNDISVLFASRGRASRTIRRATAFSPRTVDSLFGPLAEPLPAVSGTAPEAV